MQGVSNNSPSFTRNVKSSQESQSNNPSQNTSNPVDDKGKSEKANSAPVQDKQSTTVLQQSPNKVSSQSPDKNGNDAYEKVRPDATNNPNTKDKTLNDQNIKDSTKKLTAGDAGSTTTGNAKSPDMAPNVPEAPRGQQRPEDNKGSEHPGTKASGDQTTRQQASIGRGGRRNPLNDDEEDDSQQRRRRKPANFGQMRQPLTVIEGAKVSESQSQDMFVSSSHSAAVSAAGRNKTTIEQLKEYSMGNVASAVFETVIANTDHKEKNGIGNNMQKNIFTEILKGLGNVEDVLTPQYRKLVREVVQGAMRAATENNVGLKDMAKMIVSGLMAMSPHDDDPKIMAETVKIIVSEIIFGKVNIGYNMKSASYYLGAALYTLTLYYKNYQTDIEFSKELEQKLSTAFSESIWKSTGEISNYSQVYAKTNIEQFMAGRVDEEKAYQKNQVKGMLLSPFNNILKK